MDELGRGRGLVSRLVASDITGPQFESSHRQTLYYLYTVQRIEQTKTNEKEAGNCPFFKGRGSQIK